MSEKKMAVVGHVMALHQIPGADRILRAEVACGDSGTWSGVVGLDMQLGERATVFLQDALLPPGDERWSFMEKHNWRVRMARFRGVPSECLIVRGAPDLPIGTDLSEALGVTKYEKPVPAAMAGETIGSFPSNIPKTDEVNFQAAPELVERMRSEPWYATEKADGTSCTAWTDAEGLHVCSRNWELREFSESGATNAYWRAARKYGLDRLPAGRALQFEVVGPGIQGNPMGLAELEARAFTLRDTREHRYLPWAELVKQTDELYIPTARFIANGTGGPCDDELRKMAEIKYPNGKHAEGIVIRALDSSWSFKVINLLYKD